MEGPDGWRETLFYAQDRLGVDAFVVEGGRLLLASSQLGKGSRREGMQRGLVEVLRAEGDGWTKVLTAGDYNQGVMGYNSRGSLALAGDRVLVGFKSRFSQRGGIEVGRLVGC